MAGETHAKLSRKGSGKSRPASRGQQPSAHRQRATSARPAQSERDGACPQRERLVRAISDLLARDRQDPPTVTEIIALANVSRPTFYGHFSDKEDCLLAALAPIRRELLDDVDAAVNGTSPARALAALTGALVRFASSRQQAARLLLRDPLAGGPRLLDCRDQLIAEIAAPVNAAFARLPAEASIPDVPPEILIGVICRLLAQEQGARAPTPNLHAEILDWLAAHDLPISQRRWHAQGSSQSPPRSPYLPPAALRAPAPLPRARARLTEQAIIENQWLRIVFATAELVAEGGYDAATVTEITRRAGLDGRAFYRLFASKQHALAAARELLFRHLMAVTAGAFAAGESWPERIWQASCAFTQYLHENAALASAALLESHAAGAEAARRFHSLTGAFTIFLEEGERYEPPAAARRRPPPSALLQQAAVTAVLELSYRYARATEKPGIADQAAHVAFMMLTPFIGAPAARTFLSGKQPKVSLATPPVTSTSTGLLPAAA